MFGRRVQLEGIPVKLVYEGHRVKVNIINGKIAWNVVRLRWEQDCSCSGYSTGDSLLAGWSI